MKKRIARYFWVWLPTLIGMIMFAIVVHSHKQIYLNGYRSAFKDCVQAIKESYEDKK